MEPCFECAFSVHRIRCQKLQDHKYVCDCPKDGPKIIICRRYPTPKEVDGEGCGEHRKG